MSRPASKWREMRWIPLWDGREAFGRWVDGLPAFRFGWAPAGLMTRRQLRERGLCPGGHGPFALLVWKDDKQWAHLYRVDLAAPKRVPTLRQRAALAKAMRARRWCPGCGRDVGYCVSTRLGICDRCDERQAVHAPRVDYDTPGRWEMAA